MYKKHGIEQDSLSGYLQRDKIEKAPEGITDRIMTRIQSEGSPFIVKNSSLSDYKVLLIFAAITSILIILAIFMPTSGNDYTVYSIPDIPSNIPIIFNDLNLDKITGFALPGWIFYISIGLFLLSIFDRALNSIFHRDRR